MRMWRGDPVSYVDPFGLAQIPDPNGVVPGGPWKPNPNARPGNYLGPKPPKGGRMQCQWVPSEAEGGPPGSDGYWKTNQPGQKGWDRFSQRGEPITPEEAHPGRPQQTHEPAKQPAPQTPETPDAFAPSWLRSLGPAGVFIWGMTRSGPAY
jgi:hypothetical protein